MEVTESPSLNIWFDMTGAVPRISRVVHDYGDGKAIKNVTKYNSDQGHESLLHVQVTKEGGAKEVN